MNTERTIANLNESRQLDTNKDKFSRPNTADSVKRRWILAGMLTLAAAVFLGIVHRENPIDGGLQVPLNCGLQIYVLMLFLYAAGVLALFHKQWRTVTPAALFAGLALLALSLFMRMGLFPFVSGDYIDFLSEWIAQIQKYDGLLSLSAEIGNYNAPYFYLLIAIAKFRPDHGLFYIKAASVLFDFLAAYAVRALVSECTENRLLRHGSFFAALMVPTIILNGACWAQCDGIYASLALLAVVCGMQKRSKLSFCFFALSLAFKLQAVFLLPMVFVLIGCKRVWLKDIWVFFAAFLVTLLPALLVGRSLPSLLQIYVNQTTEYNEQLVLAAATFFSWLPEAEHGLMESQYLGLGLACMSCLTLLSYCWYRRNRLDNRALAECAFLFALIIPFFLPYMHERYFYCAELLAAVYLALYPRRFPVCVTIWLCGIFSYLVFLLRQHPIPPWYLSIALFFAICDVCFLFVKRIEQLPTRTEGASISMTAAEASADCPETTRKKYDTV